MATLSLRPSNEPTLGKHVRARAAAMQTAMEDMKKDWHEIAMHTGHPRIKALCQTQNGGSRPKSKILYDGHAIRAFRYVESGIYSGMSSPHKPWFKFKLADDDLMTHAVKVWLEECEQVILNMLAASNFYSVARSNYGELSKFGTTCGIMDEEPSIGLNCTALTVGEYAIAINHLGKVDTLLRMTTMTTRQMVQKFVRGFDGEMDWSRVSQGVKSAWDQSAYNQTHPVWHLIEPNADYREGGWGADGMLWRSVKWEATVQESATKDGILENRGYEDQPFWAPRWRVHGEDTWGMGPGHDALPDMRELQFQAKRKGEVTDLVSRPPTQGPAREVKLRPGSHTAVASPDAGKVEVIYQAPYQAINLVAEDVTRCHGAINEASYADLFMAISQMDGVQPRNEQELVLRNDEKMTQLGPVIEGVNVDMLSIAVERAWGIAERGELLPDPPEGIEGKIDIEFISVLAQAQKMMGAGQTERSLAFVGAVAQFQPDVIDKIDGDALVEDHWSRSSAPAVGLRDEKVVQDIRSQRAQKQQMEQMAAMAAPAKDGVEAAALLNEIGQQ